ncbi:MAG: hypothetical protein R2853_21035 [Thermomicrobiales bacterium]|nr:hypothetical protein [Thermomicrobiales bacterium]
MRQHGRDARAARLRRAIDGLRAAGEPAALDLAPRSAHEALTRQMVSDLAADLSEVKSRVNAMLWLVAGAVVVDVALRLTA